MTCSIGEDDLVAYVKIKNLITTSSAAETDVAAVAASPMAVTRHISCEETPFDMYDSEHFMDALRSEEVFEPVASDDINLSATPLPVEYGSEEDSEVGEEDDMDDLTEYVPDVASSDSDEEDEPITFDVPENELRDIGASGWESYDADHCGLFGVK
ncbi:hypothetical protein BBJ28_00015647 [Nothophytophthora sp. Chile5]|nr:hypothetical protein BBJ28_00015647 [Nothophytophthora sp. Chile5]